MLLGLRVATGMVWAKYVDRAKDMATGVALADDRATGKARAKWIGLGLQVLLGIRIGLLGYRYCIG